ncbi:GNAT family N-acetyltransferase [Streptomyces durmitorensis]|uniref:GNAT family N-acetyltransferase n=1 Tax=Streptomyces durmitorensis TaxID=319947 RepID=A0ABY4Q9G4_9ACTN|nr:GNAT family N-acetyltransferase [Streptomyces durmitorensis]UQT61749.1 GNAT family N-acetyltransferase [Streptomyces durmitorensis]
MSHVENSPAETASWAVAPEAVDSPVASALWRAYYTEVSDRYYLLHEKRRTAPEELEREIAAETGADLRPPTGVLLVARHEGEPAGTAGVRLMGDLKGTSTAELKRVFLREDMRGKGGAALLLAAAEDAARALGAGQLILDTRLDLVEARALYARHGYEESEPLTERMYAECWYVKRLAPAAG